MGSVELPGLSAGNGWDIKTGVTFSPLDDNVVAYDFDFEQDGNATSAVLKINRATPNNETTTFIYPDYVYVDFLSDGRVVLTHKEGGIYISDGWADLGQRSKWR